MSIRPFINPGDTIFCAEQSTDRVNSGVLEYRPEGRLETVFTAFNDRVNVAEADPIILLTDRAKYVSLYGNFTTERHRKLGPGMALKEVNTQRIVSTFGIVGDAPWQTTDRIKAVSFNIDHSLTILENRDALEKLGRISELESPEERYLFKLRAAGATISLYYTAGFSLRSQAPENVQARFEIEFDECKSLSDYSKLVEAIIAFFSFNLGVPLTPSEVRITQFSNDEIMKQLEKGNVTPDHEFIALFNPFPIHSDEIELFSSPYNSLNSCSLENLSEALSVWLNRDEEWHNAYSVMMGSLKHRNTISGDRLIAACKWLEEIPASQALQVLDDKKFSSIVEAARKAASDAEANGLSDRISNGLKSIKLENSSERFRRLCRSVPIQVFLGTTDVEMAKDLKKAIQMRGRVAHRNLGHGKIDDLNVSIKVVEALCFLLTLRELPSRENSEVNIRLHRLLSEYRFLTQRHSD
jgi:hypothetical protein